MSSTKSGLQKDVLKLYRRALRMVNTKPETARPKFSVFVRYTFHVNASKVSPRNVTFIEHLLRKGTRQLEAFEDSGVKDCWVSAEMVQWDQQWRKSSQRTSSSTSS